MSQRARKRVNIEDPDLRETNEEKRVRSSNCDGSTQQVMARMEAYDKISIPRTVESSSEASTRNYGVVEKQALYDIKESFRLCSRRCWDKYWSVVLDLIREGRMPRVTFNEMYKDLYRSICQTEPEAPSITYARDVHQILSVRSWLLLNPTEPEHPEEEVIICSLRLISRSAALILEQKNDGGANAEYILSERLKLIKEKAKEEIVGPMEITCSWSFCKRCIKHVVEEIKQVHSGITKIIIKTRSSPTVSSFFGLEIHPFTADCWKEMRKYLTDEGNAYIGDESLPASQLYAAVKAKSPNMFRLVNIPMVHCRVMPLRSWFLFNEQLRTCNVRGITCIVCCVTFNTTTAPYCLHQTNDFKDVHAEAVTLLRLETIQDEAKKRNDSIRCIKIYSTYSPCISCISSYSNFVESMPELEELHLIVSSVYMSNDFGVNAELGRFMNQFQHKVKVQAFNDEHWEALKDHLNEECVEDLRSRASKCEASQPLYSSCSSSPANTPRKVKH